MADGVVSANRVLDAIRDGVDADGVWRRGSWLDSLVTRTELSERSVSTYLKVLERLKVISRTKERKKSFLNPDVIVVLRLLKPNCVVVWDDKFMGLAEREA